MKNTLTTFLFILILSVVGCQQKEDVMEPAQITGQWQLMRVEGTNMIANQPPSLPSDPLYQEILEFKSDGTFTRSRSNGYRATGTYSQVHYGKDDFGVLAIFTNPDLNYQNLPTTPVLQQSSGYNGQLYLRQIKPNELMEDHRAFDGYNFFYQKVKDNN